ncbi:MAG: BlaI/MecI/CopY family transcriptional regulator [Bacteroidota bacterium]
MQYPSEAELEILQVLWASPGLTAKEVHEALAAVRGVKPTTILKQMQRMTDKGLIAKLPGKQPQKFEAQIAESDVQGGLLQRLVDTAFKGSAQDMLLHVLGQQDPSAEELDALRKWIDAQEENSSTN